MDFGGRSNFEQTFKSRTCFLLSSFSSRFGSRYITRTGIWIWQWQMPLNLRCNLINGHPNFLEGTTGGPPNSWILGNVKLTVWSKIFCQIFSFLCSPYKTEYTLVKYSKNKLPEEMKIKSVKYGDFPHLQVYVCKCDHVSTV